MSEYFFLEFSFTDDNVLADDFLVQIRQHQQTNLHREAAASIKGILNWPK